MIIACPECGVKTKVKADLAGKRVRCPQCQAEYQAGATTSRAQWYYASGEQKTGPLSQAQFDELVAQGTIGLETLVWRKGMSAWQSLAKTGLPKQEAEWFYAVAGQKTGPLDQAQFDAAIGDGIISRESLVWRKGMADWQRLDEVRRDNGSKGTMDMKYAGWGRRSAAKLLDMILMAVLGLVVESLSRKLFPVGYSSSDMLNPVFLSTMTINMLLGIFYITWFVGKYGATPGKMAVKIKIVNPAGGKIGYGHAFGRYCGEFVVVFLTLTLGYLFGLFDAQKRTLHDRLCNTRVIEA